MMKNQKYTLMLKTFNPEKMLISINNFTNIHHVNIYISIYILKKTRQGIQKISLPKSVYPRLESFLVAIFFSVSLLIAFTL